MLRAIFVLLVVFCSLLVIAQTMPPEADKQLARDIYKEFVEIQSGFTTGSTTPVADAAAARLRAAGFPDSDIFVGGAIPKKANLVVRYHGTGAAGSRSCSSPTPTLSKPSAKTGAWIRFSSPKRTASSTDAAPATTRRKRPSGSRT